MLKVITIIGTRPEVIKTSVLHKLLLAHPRIQSLLCSTGQHNSLLYQAAAEFNIKFDIEFKAIEHNLTLSHQTSYILNELQSLISEEKPELIIVQGDTLSAFCGAMVAFNNRIKLLHIEAGLRTYNKWGPYPEDVYRRYIDIVADFHCTPSETARQNLLNEGHLSSTVFLTGNTGVDALIKGLTKINSPEFLVNTDLQKTIANIRLKSQKIILLTCHRRETFGDTLFLIVKRILAVADKYNFQVVLTSHPNPLQKKSLLELLNHPKLHLISPQAYHNFLWLMQACDLIITDSGGIQEEAPYIGKGILVIRNETERKECLSTKQNTLVDISNIEKSIEFQLQQEGIKSEPYGNGHSSEKILEIINAAFNLV